MKTIGSVLEKFRKKMGILALAVLLAAGMMGASFTAYAESAAQAKTNAKIRKEPSTSSETIGSVEKDKTISVSGQTTGSDGYTWYQVYVDANTLGYIRSDLAEITDGSTPATVSATTTTTTTTTTTGGSTATTSTPDETVVDVTAVNPVSASVSGNSPVRVRQNASTTSRIYATVEGGSALTVTGTATGTDGNQWYQVNFISGGSEVNGFIRADYVTLGGELTEAGTETGETDTDVGTDTADETTETETKDWDTYQSDDGEWHLQNNTTGEVYSVTTIFENVESNAKIANDALSAKKTLQTVVIILVIVMVAMVAAIGYLIFRVKDMTDSAYYSEVEQETLRRRAGGKQQEGRQAAGGKQQAGHQAAGGAKPAVRTGAKPQQAGKTTRANGQRPATKPGGQNSAQKQPGNTPAAEGRRPASGTGSQGAGQNQAKKAASSEGQRTAPGADNQASGVSRSEGAAQKPVSNEARKPAASQEKPQKPAWKSKNFVADDDEFEFEFLNWDGEEE